MGRCCGCAPDVTNLTAWQLHTSETRTNSSAAQGFRGHGWHEKQIMRSAMAQLQRSPPARKKKRAISVDAALDEELRLAALTSGLITPSVSPKVFDSDGDDEGD